jgi:hypothetical protein
VSALLVLLAAILWYRESDEGVPATDDGGSRDSGPSRPETDPQVTESLFDHATAHLESGDADSAVQASYSAVRRQFEATIDAGKALTHWEFYRAYLDAGVSETEDGSDNTEDALRDLTEAYERAVYSPGSVQIDDAARTVERARRLCARTDGGTASAGDDSRDTNGE